MSEETKRTGQERNTKMPANGKGEVPMKSQRNVMFVLAALALVGSGLQAGPITCPSSCNIGTGQAPGTANTASDPIWTIGSAPSGNTSGPAVIIGSPIWSLSLPAGINWIATIPGADAGAPGYAGGDYIYELSLNSTASYIATFGVAADNAVNVFLDASAATLAADGSAGCTPGPGSGGCLGTWGDFNNVSATGWSSFSNLSNPSFSTGLISGQHTIYLEVENGPSSYTGVVVQGLVDGRGTVIIGATPEPTTWAMLGTGLSLVGLLRRRRRATL